MCLSSRLDILEGTLGRFATFERNLVHGGCWMSTNLSIGSRMIMFRTTAENTWRGVIYPPPSRRHNFILEARLTLFQEECEHFQTTGRCWKILDRWDTVIVTCFITCDVQVSTSRSDFILLWLGLSAMLQIFWSSSPCICSCSALRGFAVLYGDRRRLSRPCVFEIWVLSLWLWN